MHTQSSQYYIIPSDDYPSRSRPRSRSMVVPGTRNIQLPHSIPKVVRVSSASPSPPSYRHSQQSQSPGPSYLAPPTQHSSHSRSSSTDSSSSRKSVRFSKQIQVQILETPPPPSWEYVSSRGMAYHHGDKNEHHAHSEHERGRSAYQGSFSHHSEDERHHRHHHKHHRSRRQDTIVVVEEIRKGKRCDFW
jgi:hypothetical protein